MDKCIHQNQPFQLARTAKPIHSSAFVSFAEFGSLPVGNIPAHWRELGLLLFAFCRPRLSGAVHSQVLQSHGQLGSVKESKTHVKCTHGNEGKRGTHGTHGTCRGACYRAYGTQSASIGGQPLLEPAPPGAGERFRVGPVCRGLEVLL